jgi:hypothetical protein
VGQAIGEALEVAEGDGHTLATPSQDGTARLVAVAVADGRERARIAHDGGVQPGRPVPRH